MNKSTNGHPYQTQDPYRLDRLSTYLDGAKQGSPSDWQCQCAERNRIAAIDALETTLWRIHNTYAIAWDFGGVLMDGHNRFFIELYARSHGANLRKDQLEDLWKTIFKSDPIPGVNYDALKIGQATPEQFATHAIEAFNSVFVEAGYEPVELGDRQLKDFLTLYYSHYDPKHENRDILARIHRIGIRQYGLTNNFMAKVEYFLGQHEFDYLQNLIAIVSEKFGTSKPDPKIYRLFKQHVFLDCFAREILGVKLPDKAIEQLWQEIFQPLDPCEIEQLRSRTSQVSTCYQRLLEEFGHSRVEDGAIAAAWTTFWDEHYHRIGAQTIFVDDKVGNLDKAFISEGILGVHYDANQGQALHKQPVLEELLDRAGLKEAISVLRELTVSEDKVGQRARQSLQRLMPLRVRHERQILDDAGGTSATIAALKDSLSDEELYDLLQTHYDGLYATHFKQGQLVSQQYALVHRIASLPMYSYDDARAIVLELFETSDLFLDQNPNRYPWQRTPVPANLDKPKDLAVVESILERTLLSEPIGTIIDYVNAIGAAGQPPIQDILQHLRTKVSDVAALKNTLAKLIEQLGDLESLQVVPYTRVQKWVETLRQLAHSAHSHEELKTALLDRLDLEPAQLQQQQERSPLDLLPLERLVSDWEAEIRALESDYFRQYDLWKTLKEQYKGDLCQDKRLQGVGDRISQEEIYQYMRDLTLRIYDLPRWKDLTRPTIVLVSGASGSGKSTLSAQLARSLGIQKLFSTDETGRANFRALLEYLFASEAQSTYPALYQSSFEGSLASYYCQSMLTIIGVEGLMQRLQKQNCSAIIEGVGLMPGFLGEATFKSLNLDWLILELDRDRHWDNFTARGQAAAGRQAQRYQDNFIAIRNIHDQIASMGLAHGLTIVENQGAIAKVTEMAIERICAPTTDAFHPVRDPLREEVAELLDLQRRHLPLKIEFDVARSAIDLGIDADKIRALLHRFGFEPVPNRRHQWVRQPLREVPLL